MPTVHLLDYVAGNIRSLVNAIEVLGYTVEWIKSPEDVVNAEKLILPGVGHFGHCLTQLSSAGYLEPVRKHIDAGKPFMGICVGLQALFEGSAENPAVSGLGVIKSQLSRFDDSAKALEAQGWTVALGTYGTEAFVGAVAKGNVFATQFHPEKSGVAGLRTIKAFLTGEGPQNLTLDKAGLDPEFQDGLTRRIIACLDVRTNDKGDLVVTKGDQYDPVEMAKKYYEQGADEVTFLNITSFRDIPLADLPMLEILRRTSETVFVPLTIGGGIRDAVDTDGTKVSALEIATMYFKSGADKVSIGSDAVLAAEEYYAVGKKLFGNTAIEQISRAYGNQAIVVSVDPKRVYVPKRDATRHSLVETAHPGPNGDRYCWYACTIKGGRETRDVDVVELVQAVEAMGAGEILLNCIDKDGSNSGYDLELISQVKAAIKIPVIASSGAGNPGHFHEVFEKTTTDAALGAGMFHRGEYTVKQVKDFLAEKGLVVRKFEDKL
ncbi:unnamed protein product [Parascedosporium putredinis]|uniref:Glutamine amidotransferase domain-containing protein n=1 Tax=Parascedosporium putredinis TaxID=1442378 RepID=A0A9P1H3V5_9PEZI|nr:unnamed protein product [Parascedosporium putredinis]CAI7995477.1 unnamed protein product [Parascedosporium putredinis]